MVSELFTIIHKDFLRILRAKGSSLIIILGPLIIMLLGGLAFTSSGLYGINVGLYDKLDTDLADILKFKLEEGNFSVINEDSLESCKNNVKQGNTHICIEIKERENTPKLLEQKLGNKVVFYLDYSNIRLVWAITSVIRTVVASESNKISRGIIDKGMDNLDTYTNFATENRKKILDLKNTQEEIRDKLTRILNAIDQNQISSEQISQQISDISNNINLVKSNLQTFNTRAMVSITSLKQMGGNSAQYAANLERDLQTLYSPSLQSLNSATSTLYNMESSINSNSQTIFGIKTDISRILDMINQNLIDLNQIDKVFQTLDTNLGDIQQFDPDLILQPIPVEYKPVSEDILEAGSISNSVTYLDYLLPSLLILVIMFDSILLSSILIVKEKNLPVYFRNMISPTNDIVFALSIFISSLFLVLTQVAILLIISSFVFGISLQQNLAEIAILITIISSIFILFGMLIGYIFKSEETSTVAGISTIILFLLFSSILLPVETLPSIIGSITKFSPFVVAEIALRKIMIFDLSIALSISELLVLSIYFVVLSSVVILAQSLIRKRST